MIHSCSFGSMVINGKRYTSDLMIYPDGHVEDSWRRRRGHSLAIDDIKGLVESSPEVIVAGAGTAGLVKPEKGLDEQLSRLGIQFIVAANQEAMEIYNSLLTQKRVGACFHLTC